MNDLKIESLTGMALWSSIAAAAPIYVTSQNSSTSTPSISQDMISGALPAVLISYAANRFGGFTPSSSALLGGILGYMSYQYVQGKLFPAPK